MNHRNTLSENSIMNNENTPQKLFKVDCIKKDITEEQLKRQPTSLAEEIKTKTLLPFSSTLKTATGLELFSQMKHKYYFKKKVFSMEEN